MYFPRSSKISECPFKTPITLKTAHQHWVSNMYTALIRRNTGQVRKWGINSYFLLVPVVQRATPEARSVAFELSERTHCCWPVNQINSSNLHKFSWTADGRYIGPAYIVHTYIQHPEILYRAYISTMISCSDEEPSIGILPWIYYTL